MKELIKNRSDIMKKLLRRFVIIDVTEKDYFKVCSIFEGIYPMDYVSIESKKDKSIRITFECRSYRREALLHDVNLAIKLGTEVKIKIA